MYHPATVQLFMARDIQSLNDWILVQCFYVPNPYRDGLLLSRPLVAGLRRILAKQRLCKRKRAQSLGQNFAAGGPRFGRKFREAESSYEKRTKPGAPS